MPNKNISSNIENTQNFQTPVEKSPLHEEYEIQQALNEAQPVMVVRFLELQAKKLADACWKNQNQASFSLPDQVVANIGEPAKVSPVPAQYREQSLGSVISRLTKGDMRALLRQRLAELEAVSNPGVSTAARLVRHAVAIYMVYEMLPAGRSVVYETLEGEEIPTVPIIDETIQGSAITQASDAIVEEAPPEENRGDLQVPFVPDARRFYLPQWVAFDLEGYLLSNSVNEAEGHIASMQSFLAILHLAVSITPYMITDPVYQQKRYGMLGQLVNQGRALAHYETDEMIHIIKKRAASHDLNRGLSLSVPYFDDQVLELHTHDFEVIPAGRIMFVPAFVVRAVQMEKAKVAQDTRLSPSTRKYLLKELTTLGEAFLPGQES